MEKSQHVHRTSAGLPIIGAIEMNRKAIGAEIDKATYDCAKINIEEAKNNIKEKKKA